MRRKVLSGMLVVLLVAAIALGVGLGVGLTRTYGHQAGTTSALQALRAEYELPALAVGEGGPGYFASQAVGIRKEGNPKPALKTDIYHLGSNAKAMTATVLALLIQDGHFSWSTTLSDALPGFNISSTHDGTTIEMLTAHRSGITDGYIKDIAFTLSLYNMSAIEGRWAVSNRSLASPPSHSPGSYTYANTNYVLAGLIIDVASSNSSAEALLCGRVFDPLGITTAGFGPVPETSDTSVDNPWPHMPSPSGSVPYSQVPNSERDNPPALNTAGRVHMAPSDYDRFLQLHLAGASTGSGLATSNPLNLTSSSFAKLYEPYPESNISAPGYGYTYGGWLQRNYTQAQPGAPVFTLFHDGSNTLNFAVALLDTKLDEAYMALTNVEGTGALTATDEAVLAMRNGTISLL